LIKARLKLKKQKRDFAGNSERDFSPHLLDIIKERPSPLPRAVLYGLMVFLGLLFVWALFGRLDVIVRASGTLVPKTRLQVVQPLEGGRVAKILVHEGELVQAGQVLVLMDSHLSEADTHKLENEVSRDKLQLRRIDAELHDADFKQQDDDPRLFEEVYAQFQTNRAAYRQTLSQLNAVAMQASEDIAGAKEERYRLGQALQVYKQTEAAYLKLEPKGYVSRLDVLEKRRQRIEAERDYKVQAYKISSLKAKMDETHSRIASLDSDYRKELLDSRSELEAKLDKLNQELRKQQYRNKLMALKAPQTSYVQNLATHTPGSIAPSGTVLLTLVPVNEPLEAEVLINNEDIGFVHPGQTAKIKLSSYEFQRYGTIDSSVFRISPDAIQQDEDSKKGHYAYKLLLALKRQSLEHDGHEYRLKPGMQVSAEVNVGSRTVMDFILSPIQKTLDEAATER
jgi:hemolysin D